MVVAKKEGGRLNAVHSNVGCAVSEKLSDTLLTSKMSAYNLNDPEFAQLLRRYLMTVHEIDLDVKDASWHAHFAYYVRRLGDSILSDIWKSCFKGSVIPKQLNRRRSKLNLRKNNDIFFLREKHSVHLNAAKGCSHRRVALSWF